MKDKIIKITEDLKQGIITETEARTILLGLFGVSGSLPLTSDTQQKVWEQTFQKWLSLDNKGSKETAEYLRGYEDGLTESIRKQ